MDYFRATRTATYGFLAALPLLLLYELSILFVNHGSAAGVRVGADVWMKSLLLAIGAPGMLAVGVAVIAVGVAVFYTERQKPIPLRPSFFGGIVAESMIYAVGVAFLVSITVSLLLAMVQEGDPIRQLPLLTRVSLSLGAGLYEELVFRVLLVGGLAFLLNRLFARPAAPDSRMAYGAAAVIGALLFSAIHYVGPFGDSFQVASFLFRFLFGLAMNAIFLLRGFAVAAWTHALYDVLVVTGMLG